MNVLNKYVLFLDLDGVLVDFERGVKDLFGKSPESLSPKQMWPRLARTPDFYANLKWMGDGQRLWEFCAPYGPIILTGVPYGNWAETQKKRWCAKELGEDVEMITCLSRQKAQKAKERDPNRIPVLVDDRQKLCVSWEEMGGIFILHKDVDTSIIELEKLGY